MSSAPGGSFAAHKSSWRRGDIHRDAETDGQSRFDRLAAAFNAGLEAAAHHVSIIAGDAADGFRPVFRLEFGFEVFPCVATSSPRREFWRLFQPATENRHVVFGTAGPGAA